MQPALLSLQMMMTMMMAVSALVPQHGERRIPGEGFHGVTVGAAGSGHESFESSFGRRLIVRA